MKWPGGRSSQLRETISFFIFIQGTVTRNPLKMERGVGGNASSKGPHLPEGIREEQARPSGEADKGRLGVRQKENGGERAVSMMGVNPFQRS